MEISSDVENKMIREQIPECNPDLARKILLDTKYKRDMVGIHAPSKHDREIQIAGLKGSYCFRIRFRLPVTALIPTAAQLLTGRLTYYRSAYATCPIAFVATYLPNLNHFTLLRLYGDRAGDYVDANGALTGDACVKFVTRGGRKMEFSSLNFMERQSATQENISTDGISAIRRCFEFSFWKIPPLAMGCDYSSMHYFIYNDNRKIRAIYRIFKTIFKAEEIGTYKRSMGFTPHGFKYVEATGRLLSEEGGSLVSKRSRLFIAEQPASRLKANDVVTCLLAVPERIGGQMPPRMVLVGTVGSGMLKSDYRSIISIVFWRMNQRLSGTSKLAESLLADDLRSETRKIIEANSRLFGPSFLDGFDENFQKSLSLLRPCFLPPRRSGIQRAAGTAKLSDYQRFARCRKTGSSCKTGCARKHRRAEKRVFLMRGGRMMGIRRSRPVQELQKHGDLEALRSLLRDLPRLSNRMVYSRAISHHPAQ